MQPLLALLLETSHGELRGICEIAVGRLFLAYPECFLGQVESVLRNPNSHGNLLVPLLMLAGVLMLARADLEQQLFNLIWPYATSHTAFNRGLAQHFCYRTSLASSEFLRLPEQVLGKARETVKVNAKIQAAVATFQDELRGLPVAALFARSMGGNVPRACSEMLKLASEEIAECMDEDRNKYAEKDIWALGRELAAKAEEGRSGNYQKKMSPVEEELAWFRAGREQAPHELIVVASLLEKVPNFGHLVRTCEVFGVSALAIPDLRILQD